MGVAAAEPLFVLATDAATNKVVAGPVAALSQDRVRLGRATLHRAAERVGSVKLRYRSRPVPCRTELDADGRVELALTEGAPRPAPGQEAVPYDGPLVVGRGEIL